MLPPSPWRLECGALHGQYSKINEIVKRFHSQRPIILGGAETAFTRRSSQADLQFIGAGIASALANCGVARRDVDGLAVCANVLPDDSSYVAEHLGLRLRWALKADHGGASSVISVARAAAAIAAGHAEVVVCVGGGNRADFPYLHHDATSPPIDYAHRSFVLPYGYGGPNSFFGLVQRRHMHLYGTTLDQLGKIAVTFRRHAQLNTNALLRDPMTIDDYVDSPLIADPIRKLDCVMRCAGAVAVVVCSQRYAERIGAHAVTHIASYAEDHGQRDAPGRGDRLATGFTAIRDELFGKVARHELDFLQLYDDYPIAILRQIEDLGFCELGEGGPWIESTDISLTGSLPINTSGGILSCGQPRLGGGFIGVLEAVRQLQGTAGDRQLAAPNAGLVSGIGLMSYASNLAVTCGMVLSSEACE